MKKSDIIISLVIGEITAWYFIYLLKELDIGPILWSLIVFYPILSVIGLEIAFLISKRFLFVFQLAKFLLTGAFAAVIDLGILYVLISISGISAGIIYALFKGISFIVANCFKYFGDKIWAFKKKGTAEPGKEFAKFFLVTFVGLLINIAAASFVVDYIGPQFGFSAELWANIGGIIGGFATVLWNFPGYKFIVFKK